MHAAEHDELGIRIRGELRQLQRVAGEIGVLEHLIALVMMAEDAKPLAENFLDGNDARIAFAVIQQIEFVKFQCGSRSEERRVGKECVSTCRYRWSPEH